MPSRMAKLREKNPPPKDLAILIKFWLMPMKAATP